MATTKQILERFQEAVDMLLLERDETDRVLKAKEAHLADLQRIIFEFGWVELQRGSPIKLVEEGD